jgi:hypothetical protein
VTDEHALRRDAERATRAAALVNDELLNEAFDLYENELITAWKNSPSNSSEAREHAYWALKALIAVRATLEGVIAGGTLAKAELDQILGR